MNMGKGGSPEPNDKTMSTAPDDEFESDIARKDEQIAFLQQQVESLSSQLQASLQGVAAKEKRKLGMSPHAINIREEQHDNKRAIASQPTRMGRSASLATRNILDQLSAAAAAASMGGGRSGGGSTSSEGVVGPPPPIQRILDMFQKPDQHMDYLNSNTFAKDLVKLSYKVKQLFESEPRVIYLESPAYVFGDIHGNLEDLHFFSDNVWRLGMSLTAGNFLFLGDYVDRGMSCLETVAYLFAMKQQLPNKVFMLRGNHETRDVNGWEEHYGERAFIYQCRARFGDDIGYRVWESINQVFDRMPLAAVIDQDIFCVHGGIPRPVGTNTTRIQDILTVHKVAGINPPYEHEDDTYQQVGSDCIWSDPASESQEMSSVDPDTGFGDSLRGGGAICFGHKAVTDFLQQQDFSYIMRAHEAHAEGVAISKGARVFTVFSTSKDHNQGSHAMAGCILVDNEKLQVINRSPAYKNQYVHRRDSVSLAHLSEADIQKRIQLGLVTNPAGDDDDDDDEDLEDWEDFEDSDEEAEEETEEYVFAKQRRSSVDLSSLNENFREEAASWDTEDGENASNLPDFEPKKRRRSKRPSVASIDEDGEDEDIETVNGDEDVELRDAGS